MADSFVFHIRNANPHDMAAVLAVLQENPENKTISEIVDAADLMGYSIRDRQRLEALATARDLNLLVEKQNVLTKEGRFLADLEIQKPDLFADIVHGLIIASWSVETPNLRCFSWSYGHLCQMLWQSGSVNVDNRKDLAARLENDAREEFGQKDIVFSSKSIGGALAWLSELHPSVFDEQGKRFTRRPFCPPELMALAIDHVYKKDRISYGANLLINAENLNTLCQFCIIEPSGFDRVLNYCVSQFDFINRGVGGGWGHYVVLTRQPIVEDFLPSIPT